MPENIEQTNARAALNSLPSIDLLVAWFLCDVANKQQPFTQDELAARKICVTALADMDTKDKRAITGIKRSLELLTTLPASGGGLYKNALYESAYALFKLFHGAGDLNKRCQNTVWQKQIVALFDNAPAILANLFPALKETAGTAFLSATLRALKDVGESARASSDTRWISKELVAACKKVSELPRLRTTAARTLIRLTGLPPEVPFESRKEVTKAPLPVLEHFSAHKQLANNMRPVKNIIGGSTLVKFKNDLALLCSPELDKVTVCPPETLQAASDIFVFIYGRRNPGALWKHPQWQKLNLRLFDRAQVVLAYSSPAFQQTAGFTFTKTLQKTLQALSESITTTPKDDAPWISPVLVQAVKNISAFPQIKREACAALSAFSHVRPDLFVPRDILDFHLVIRPRSPARPQGTARFRHTPDAQTAL